MILFLSFFSQEDNIKPYICSWFGWLSWLRWKTEYRIQKKARKKNPKHFDCLNSVDAWLRFEAEMQDNRAKRVNRVFFIPFILLDSIQSRIQFNIVNLMNLQMKNQLNWSKFNESVDLGSKGALKLISLLIWSTFKQINSLIFLIKNLKQMSECNFRVKKFLFWDFQTYLFVILSFPWMIWTKD